jgi:hypothetical protein
MIMNQLCSAWCKKLNVHSAGAPGPGLGNPALEKNCIDRRFSNSWRTIEFEKKKIIVKSGTNTFQLLAFKQRLFYFIPMSSQELLYLLSTSVCSSIHAPWLESEVAAVLPSLEQNSASAYRTSQLDTQTGHIFHRSWI